MLGLSLMLELSPMMDLSLMVELSPCWGCP